MRYFVNKLPDYIEGAPVATVDENRWISYIQRTLTKIKTRMPPSLENCDGGLYVGCAGVAYALYRLALSETRTADMRQDLLTSAASYIEESLNYASRKSRDPPIAFLLGKGGILAVASLIYDQLQGRQAAADELRKKYVELATMVCKPGDILGHGSDELFVGRAGYLCGALTLNAACKREVGRIALIAMLCNGIQLCKLDLFEKT